MKRFLRLRHGITCAALLFAYPLAAQDDPNLLMNEAIAQYTTAMSTDGEERYRLLQEVDGLLTRIENEFPDSAPASLMQMGIPLGPIDQTTLEAELAASEPQLADRLSGQLAEQWRVLQERSPDVAATVEQTLKEVSGSVVNEAKEEAYVKVSYIVMSSFYYLGGTALFEYFDAEDAASVYKAFVTGRGLDRALANIGKSTATNIAMSVALDFATSTITDFVIERAPEMKPATQTLVRAGLNATLTEVTLAVQAYKDPTKVPGLGIKRVADLIEIVVTTRGLAADVDRALAETAHRMQTMAQLTASYRDQENVQIIITDTRQNLESELERAVGKDDAKAVSDIMLLGWAALVAEFEGDTAQAGNLHGLLLARGNVDNMPTIWNAPDLLTYFANGFTDSPKRAAEIMIGLTELSKYSKPKEPVGLEVATTPSTSPDLAGTQIAPDGFLGPDVNTVLDAAYIKRARGRFLGSFSEMCALPSVQESGLNCPLELQYCEGEGCIARGPMQALAPVSLLAAPGDSRVVDKLDEGEWVFTELTRVWYAPCRATVTKAASADDSFISLPPIGSTVWITTSPGEGFVNYLTTDGRMGQTFFDKLSETSDAATQSIDPCHHENRESWRLMTTEDGRSGWISAPADNFKGLGLYSGDDTGDVAQWALDYPKRSPDLSDANDPFSLVLKKASSVPTPDLQELDTPNQAELFDALPDGYYGVIAEGACPSPGFDPSSVWGQHLVRLGRPIFNPNTEVGCSIGSRVATEEGVRISLSCSGESEGQRNETNVLWRISGPDSFVALDAYGGPQTYQLCNTGDQQASNAPSQAELFDALPDGLYAIDQSSCSKTEADVGDAWGMFFRLLERPNARTGYYGNCSIVGRSDVGDAIAINWSCSSEEGEVRRSTARWRMDGPIAFTDLDTYGGPKSFQLCSSSDEVSNDLPNAAAGWSEDIVIASDSVPYECFMQTSEKCLRAAGASEQGVQFFKARQAGVGGNGPVLPIEFSEHGVVDIALLQLNDMAGTIVPYFVNTAPETILFPPRPVADAARAARNGDRVMQQLDRQYQVLMSFRTLIPGMRVLPDGRQRFSTVVTWQDCRACEFLAYSVAQVDFDKTGKFQSLSQLGSVDVRGSSNHMLGRFTVDDLRRTPALVQMFLNLRGYNAGPMDGAIGPRTKTALAVFRRENNIPQGEGSLDRSTLAALVDNETMFQNGFESASTSTQQASVGSSPLAGCAKPGRALTTAEAIDLFSGATVTKDFGGATRYETIPAEDTWFKQFGVQLGKEIQWREPVRISNGKLCTLIKGDEFCDAINICESDDAEYILTPFGGTPTFITKVEKSGSNDLSEELTRSPDFSHQVTLSWSGGLQGIVGNFTLEGRMTADGLLMTASDFSGRYNPDTRLNSIDPGTQLQLQLSASPRADCDGCKAQRSFTSENSVFFDGTKILPTSGAPLAITIPVDVLESNDLLPISLIGGRLVFLTNMTLRIGKPPATDKETPNSTTAASCSSPESLLSKNEIISALAGKSFDTRPGGNRYVLQSFSEYDWSQNSGTLIMADDRGSLEQVYSVNGSELCSQNASGGPQYCSLVRQCDPDGNGVIVGFFDGDRLGTSFGQVAVAANDRSGGHLTGSLTAPEGYKWLQLASRPDLEAARIAYTEIKAKGGEARIFKTQNGWYAITTSSPDPMFVSPEAALLEEVRAISWVPSDAFFVSGETYVQEFPGVSGDEVAPAFIRTETNRETRLYTREYGTWKRTYSNDVIKAGTSVVLWGEPDKATGDCLADGHEGVFLECAHTVAFEEDIPSNTLESGKPGKYESPWGYMYWLQVASRPTLAEAKDEARIYSREFPGTRIFKASNGWYAVVIEFVDDHSDWGKDRIKELSAAGKIPSDALLTYGSSFVEQFSVDGEIPDPAFVYAVAIRDTRVGGETGEDGSRYVGDQVIEAGDEVGVSGRYNNDCNLAHHGLAIVPCSDLSGIETLPDRADGVTQQPAEVDDAETLTSEDYRQEFLSNGGYEFVERLREITRPTKLPEEMVSFEIIFRKAMSQDPNFSTLRKLSIMFSIMQFAGQRAGADAEMFKTMNYARNIMNEPHPSYDAVTSGSGWTEAKLGEKQFHIVGIEDPDSVKKYNHPDGREAVFKRSSDGTWLPLFDGVNDATYNVVPNRPWDASSIYRHMIVDVVPWIVYGLKPGDEDGFIERLAAFENSSLFESFRNAVDSAEEALEDPVGETGELIERLPPESLMTAPMFLLQ